MIEKEDLIDILHKFWSDTYFDESNVINYLKESGIDMEEGDIFKQTKEIELKELYAFTLVTPDKNKYHAIASTDKLPSEPFRIYKAEFVDKKIAFYEKLIDKMKCCDNCKYYELINCEDYICSLADICTSFEQWKLKT